MDTRTLSALGLDLRELAWPDIDAVTVLEEQVFPDDAWSAATWWEELAGRPRRDYLVVVDRCEQVVGYAGLDDGGDVADVMTIAVAPSVQRAGLGRFLLDELERRAIERGAQSLVLEVRADNLAALRMYEGAGFLLIRTRPRYYQPGDTDALVMRKVLSPSGGDA